MLNELERNTLYENIDLEMARVGFPEDYPHLPEVPGSRYSDRAFFDLEMEHVFRKSWLFAGHVSEIPDPGSYFLFEKIGLSIIICRDMDGEVRALHNVCRHRGSAVLTKPVGKVRRLVCPYHSWGYKLDGELATVPDAPDFGCFNKANHGLRPVRCENWRGLIFINLNDDTEPLLEYLGPLVDVVANFPIEKMELKGTHRIDVNCNWKGVRDNFMEVYHVNSIHPQTAAPWVDQKSYTAWTFANGHSISILKNKFHRVSGGEKPFPSGTDEMFRHHIMNINVFPNLNFVLDTGGFGLLNMWPDGSHDKSILEFPLMGWRENVADARVEDDYWDELMKTSIVIMDEDVRLLDTVQRALDSGFCETVVFSYAERCIYWCHEEIDRLIGSEAIPPEMRVEPVMASHISVYPWSRGG